MPVNNEPTTMFLSPVSNLRMSAFQAYIVNFFLLLFTPPAYLPCPVDGKSLWDEGYNMFAKPPCVLPNIISTNLEVFFPLSRP